MGEIAATSIQESLNSRPRTGAVRKRGARRHFKGEPVKARVTTQGANVHRINGWLVSLVLHGLLLSATLPLFRQLPLTIPAEPFRWDVTLVQSIEPPTEPGQTAEATEQAVVTSTEPVPVMAQVHRPVETTASYAESSATVQPIQETAVVTEPQLRSPSSIAPPVETVPVTQEAAPMPHNVAEEPARSSPALEEQPVTALRTNNSSVQQNEPTATPITQEPPAPVVVPMSSSSTGTPASESVPPAQTAMAVPVQTGSSSATRADYGWLQRAIFQRLEELKRSSRPSLDQSRPLKVLVKAVVSNEGALVEAEVVKSSGLDRIDQEAMTLVQRAFPMQLDRTLDRQQIVMRIPITYSRD
jgi:protein TonB